MTLDAPFKIKKYQAAEMQSDVSHVYLFLGADSITWVGAEQKKSEVCFLKSVSVDNNDSFLKQPALLDKALELVKKDFTSSVQVKVFFESTCHTFVPEPLFVSEKSASYLKLSHPLNAQDQIHFNRIHQNNMVSLFAVDETISNTISKWWPETGFFHYHELLVAVSKHLSSSSSTLHVNLRKNLVDICCCNGNELVFVNSFFYESDTDVVYYILSVAEHLQIHHQDIHTVLSGLISPTNSLYGLIKKYIPQVRLAHKINQFSYPLSFKEFSDHQYLIETAALLCES